MLGIERYLLAYNLAVKDVESENSVKITENTEEKCEQLSVIRKDSRNPSFYRRQVCDELCLAGTSKQLPFLVAIALSYTRPQLRLPST